MKPKSPASSLGLLAGALSALIATAASGASPSETWNVGTGNWDTSTSNWSSGIWTNDGNAVFGGLSLWESVPNTPANETITINEAGISANNVTFNYTGINVAASGANTLSLTGTGRVTVSEVAQGPAVSWSGANSYLNAISAPIAGSVGLTKLGGGVLNLTGTNTYSGTTTVSDGVLRLGNATALPGGINATGGTSALTLNGGTVELANGNFLRNLGSGSDQFQITGGTSGFSAQGGARTVNIGGAAAGVQWGTASFAPTTLVLNAFTADSNLIVSNPIDLNGTTRTIASNSVGTSAFATLAGVISNSVGSAGLTKTGLGVLELSAATGNTYTGTTTVNGGILRLSSATALPGGIAATGGTSALTLNGGVVELATGDFLRNVGTSAEQFQITGGISGFSARGATRAVTVNNDADKVLVWGSATFNPSTLLLQDVTASAQLNLNNKIDLNGATRTIAVNGTGGTANIAGVISDTVGTGGLTKIGPGNLLITTPVTYTGLTTINGGSLTLGASNIFPNSAPIRIDVNDAQNSSLGGAPFASTRAASGSANGASPGAGWARFDMQAFSDTVGKVTVDGGAIILGNASGGVLTSTVSFEMKSGSVTTSLAGVNIPLNKTSGGLAVLAPAATAGNTYTGTTTISQGVLRIMNTLGLSGGIAGATGGSPLTINGGVLENGTTLSFTRGLGTADNQFQIPGGRSGFSTWKANQIINIGGAGSTVQWGSTYFNPSTLVLQESSCGAFTLTLQNGIDLNGATRTIDVNSFQQSTRQALITGVISNAGGSGAGLAKTGAGILVLSGDNSYDGVTTVSAGGVLNIRHANALGSVGSGTTVQAGASLQIQGIITTAAEPLTLYGTGTVNDGMQMLTNATGVSTGMYQPQSAATNNANNGALRNIADANTYSGVVTLASASRIQSDSGTLTLSAGVTGTNVNLSVGGSGNTSITAITTGTGKLTMMGQTAGATSGTLNLTGASNYTGATTVRRGTINLTGSINGATGTALDFTGAGTFQVSNVSQNMGALTTSHGDGTVASVWTSGTIVQTFTSLNARTAGVTRSFITTGGAIGTDNKIVLTGQASGFMGIGTFANSDTAVTTGDRYAFYTGGYVKAYASGDDANYLAAPTGTTIGSSTSSSNVDLTTGNITAQTTATANTITMRGSNITMTGTSPVLSTDGLISSGSVAATLGGGTTPRLQPATAGGELVLRVNGSTDKLTVSSIIQDNGTASSLTKSGAGILDLTAAPTYTGKTTVAGGVLNLNAASLTFGTLPSTEIIVDSGELKFSDTNPGISYFVGNNVLTGGTSNNSITIQNGGKLTYTGRDKAFVIGYGVNADYNTVTATGVGTNVTLGTSGGNYSYLSLGFSGDHNKIEVLDGAYFGMNLGNAGSRHFVGDNMGADYNSIKVSGTGSTFENSLIGWLTIGNMGSQNSALVEKGGIMSLGTLSVGGAAVGVVGGSNNTIEVKDVGSLLVMRKSLSIGCGTGASGNGITVSTGGMLYTQTQNNTTEAMHVFELGVSTGADNNFITVTGAGSKWMADYGWDANGNTGFPNNSAVGLQTGVLGYAETASGNKVNVLDGGLWAMNVRLEIGGTNSEVNLGNGVGAKSYGAFKDVVMNTASARVNINNGEFKFSKDAGTVTGLGQVELKGPAHITTAYSNSIDTPIFGSGSLTKEDSGTLSLTKANTYTGNTVINAGTLKLDGSGSIANSAKIVVGDTLGSTAVLDVSTMTGGFTAGSGQTLQGSGNIIGNVNVAGTLSPGNSIESLAITGNLTLANGATFEYEVNSTTLAADLQVVKGIGVGNVTLDSASGHKVYLTLGNLGNPLTAFTTGTTFSLINYTGSLVGGPSDGGGFFYGASATPLGEGGTFTAGANKWTITYGDTSGGINFTGDQVAGKFINLTAGALTAVPEPGSLLALGMLVGSGAFLRSRRKVVG